MTPRRSSPAAADGLRAAGSRRHTRRPDAGLLKQTVDFHGFGRRAEAPQAVGLEFGAQVGQNEVQRRRQRDEREADQEDRAGDERRARQQGQQREEQQILRVARAGPIEEAIERDKIKNARDVGDGVAVNKKEIGHGPANQTDGESVPNAGVPSRVRHRAREP